MNKNDIESERNASRNVMIAAWKKHKEVKALEPLEQQIVNLIKDHPEYQSAFEQAEHLEVDYPMDPSINPFLHIGLHLTILDQITMDQPSGVRDIYQTLNNQVGNVHEVEHMMMQLLIEALDSAIKNPEGNAEVIYLERLRALLA